MYIIKNACRCIGRAKGRNVLIGIIALVIAVSACIGLSIRQAAQTAKEETLASMTVTASISFDRQSMMDGMSSPPSGGMPSGGFDKGQFSQMMGNASSLTLEEYQKYAEASSVSGFYYTLTAYFNGNEAFEPVTTEDSSSSDSRPGMDGFFGGMGGMMGNMFASGDFTVVGYSSDAAMTDFVNKNSSIVKGEVFEQGSEAYTCIISQSLATYNSLSVGDSVTLTNVNSESETYTVKVVGIYQSTDSNDFSLSMFGTSQDPANRIYMSSAALQKILDASKAASTTVTDEDTGREYDTETTGTLSATYVFADTDAYYRFEEEVRELGLDDSYVVSSTDISSFESSLTPLNTLGDMAGWFLIVILAIGAVILVVLNIFNVRERKYEIGVLTAMGMKKWKVALQFMCEILIVTMIAVVIGAAIGASCSVPVTNALLANQVASQDAEQTQMDANFGRPSDFSGFPGGGGMPSMGGGGMPSMPSMGGNNFPDEDKNAAEKLFGGAVDYVTEIDSAMNLTVVWQMIGIGLLLTIVASAASVLFVMRYDPLKILANRD